MKIKQQGCWVSFIVYSSREGRLFRSSPNSKKNDMPAYGNPGPADPPGGETMDDGMPPTAQGGQEAGRLHIGAADLPPGMELNEGDIVEFKVVGPKDADGDWPIEYNTEGKAGAEPEGEGEGESKGTSWEDDFRKSMSPRAGGGENEQEAM